FSILSRSYWIPGSYAPTWSEKRTSLFKAIEKEGLQGEKGENNSGVRQRQIHDPGIQQEPSVLPVGATGPSLRALNGCLQIQAGTSNGVQRVRGLSKSNRKRKICFPFSAAGRG